MQDFEGVSRCRVDEMLNTFYQVYLDKSNDLEFLPNWVDMFDEAVTVCGKLTGAKQCSKEDFVSKLKQILHGFK